MTSLPVGVPEVADIAVVTVVLYAVLLWLKRTRRAALTLTGILIVAAAYLLARQFNLLLTKAILEGFFAIILIALVVIFREELRYFFERVAQWSLRRSQSPWRRSPAPPRVASVLSRTLAELARDRIGALVVVQGQGPIDRHLEGGEVLHGQLSEAVLKSLFDPHSDGHDGAVVIDGDRIERFGAHLPLSKQSRELRNRGTRHAAALGLSELCDALCLVASEERGTLSVARHGVLQMVGDAEDLKAVLEEFYAETFPQERRNSVRRSLLHNAREKVFALALAIVLWFVLVHESQTVQTSLRVPVNVVQVPGALQVTTVAPLEVEVTFAAERRALYFVGSDEVRLQLRAWDLAPGRTTLPIHATDFEFPETLEFVNVQPRQIAVQAIER